MFIFVVMIKADAVIYVHFMAIPLPASDDITNFI